MAPFTYTTRKACRVCNSGDLDLILDYGEMPLAGGFYGVADERTHRRFPLHLVQCRECTLLQVAETVNPEIIFSTYSYESSVNRTLVEHNLALGGVLEQKAGPGGLIVEFGCNDGVLLNPLWKRGVRVLGIDPSDVAQRASEKEGWPLVSKYFDSVVAGEIIERFGHAQVIVANNVCAHVDDPNVLIAGVAKLLASDGIFVFEVHYQRDLISYGQYDTVYHEHTCYYSLRSLERLLARNDLRLLDVEWNSIHGGSIRVQAGHRASKAKEATAVTLMLSAEAETNVRAFGRFANRHRRLLHDLISSLRAAGKRVVAYGASGRATILLNVCNLGADLIESVSDLSPLRYGRVVPGVNIPILPRSAFHEDYPDYALMTAWNYESEIVADESAFLEQGAFIVPLKNIRIV